MKVDSTRLVQLPQPRRTAASAGVDDYSTILKNSKKHQQHDLQRIMEDHQSTVRIEQTYTFDFLYDTAETIGPLTDGNSYAEAGEGANANE
jgi:hypothetical protein